MRAAVFRGAFDIQVEQVPDVTILEPTDAVVQITHACICGTDLWPYRGQGPYQPGWQTGHEWMGIVMDVGSEVRTIKMAVNMSRPGGNVGFVGAPHGSGQIPLGRMFSYNIGLRGGLAPARAYLPELLEDVLAGPGFHGQPCRGCFGV